MYQARKQKFLWWHPANVVSELWSSLAYYLSLTQEHVTLCVMLSAERLCQHGPHTDEKSYEYQDVEKNFSQMNASQLSSSRMVATNSLQKKKKGVEHMLLPLPKFFLL